MELQRAYPDFKARRTEVIAISVDEVGDAANMKTYAEASYPVLADPDHEVSRRFGVDNLLGDGVAAPATFILDGSGTVVWRHVGENAADRPSAEQTLARLP